MKYVETIPPTAEPVSYAEAKAHTRIDDDFDQVYLTNLIVAARYYAEQLMNRSLITRTIAATIYGTGEFKAILPAEMNIATLPRGPVQSITSITDYANNTVSSSNYELRRRGNIDYVYFKNMPQYPITVTYVAGYGTPAQVPQNYKVGILMHTAHLYRQREAVSNLAQIPVAHGLEAIYGLGHSGEMIG